MNYKIADTKVRVKGLPTAVYATGNQVHIWIASPTGDSSDSFQYSIPCLSETQAEQVATEWNRLLSKQSSSKQPPSTPRQVAIFFAQFAAPPYLVPRLVLRATYSPTTDKDTDRETMLDFVPPMP